MGFVPAVDEAFPELGTVTFWWSDASFVGFAGFAELGEEGFALIKGDGGKRLAGFGSDVAIDADVAKGDLQDLGSSTRTAVEGAIAKEYFEGDDRGPGRDEVGVGQDVFGGGLLGFGVESEVDELFEVLGFVGMIAVIDAGDFVGAAAVGFGEVVNGEAAFGIATSFGVDDPGADGELIGRAFGKGGHAAERMSKAAGGGNDEWMQNGLAG